MKHSYRKIGCMIAFLTTFCGIILSGCGDDSTRSVHPGGGSNAGSYDGEDVSLIILIANPDEYKGDRIKVAGLIVDSISQGDCLFARLAVDYIVNASSVICEFSKDKGDSLPEDKTKPVTISGEVEILEGIIFLRKCRLV